jgi:hypothetical protein
MVQESFAADPVRLLFWVTTRLKLLRLEVILLAKAHLSTILQMIFRKRLSNRH